MINNAGTNVIQNFNWKLIYLFSQMAFAYYKRHLVALFMTLALPLVFLVIYAFAYMVSMAPSKIHIAVSPQAQRNFQTTISALPSDSVILDPTAETGEAALQKLGVQLAIDEDPHTKQMVIYSSPSAVGVAGLIAWASERGIHSDNNQRATGRRILVRSYRDPFAPLSFLPGVLLMSILNLALFVTGTKLLQERSQGTLRLFRMLPTPFWSFILAELAGTVVIALVQTALFIALAILITGVSLSVSAIVGTVLISLLSTLCLLSLGVVIGSALTSYSNGIHVFTLVNLLIVFFGDLFFIASAYPLTRPIALVLPTTYCADLLRHVMFEQPLRFPWELSIGFIVAFTVGCVILSSKVFRFSARG